MLGNGQYSVTDWAVNRFEEMKVFLENYAAADKCLHGCPGLPLVQRDSDEQGMGPALRGCPFWGRSLIMNM